MTDAIATADITAAEKLAGVCYTPDERFQILDNIEARVLAAKARRKLPLSNNVPMASREPSTWGIRTPSDPAPGTDPHFKVPSGISLWGQLFNEGPLLNLGMALERALDVASPRPKFPQ